mmetsp:Transcript_97479/g.281261  ORF Transcript_97479/g.281261 Transcript_97479/m.281261 type:complete len:205 (+) Transcript_97479:197-811(+)
MAASRVPPEIPAPRATMAQGLRRRRGRPPERSHTPAGRRAPPEALAPLVVPWAECTPGRPEGSPRGRAEKVASATAAAATTSEVAATPPHGRSPRGPGPLGVSRWLVVAGRRVRPGKARDEAAPPPRGQGPRGRFRCRLVAGRRARPKEAQDAAAPPPERPDLRPRPGLWPRPRRRASRAGGALRSRQRQRSRRPATPGARPRV